VWSRYPAARSGDPGTIAVSVTSLTSEDGMEFFPSLSPDGKWIVYARDEAGNAQYDLMLRAVGGNTTINLTKDSPLNDTQPAFSPDGEHIAFRSSRDGGGLFLMGRTGESVRKLVGEGFNPSWSPDGKSIVYASASVGADPSGRQSKSYLSIVSVESGLTRQLSALDAMQPAWSPHGQRIAYWGLADNNSGQRDLWTVGADGRETVRITNDAAFDWSPAWSPDGHSLYFSSNRSGGYSLWRVAIDETTGHAGDPIAVPVPRPGIEHLSFSADGVLIAMASFTSQQRLEALEFDPERSTIGARRRLTNSTEDEGTPAVSPDGQWIAFHKTHNDNQEDLSVIRSDGGGLRDVTHDIARDRVPRWSADGRRIIFYSDRSGTSQIWSVTADGGALMQLTDLPHSMGATVVSPDGTRALSNVIFPAAKLVMFDPRLSSAQQRTEELPTSPKGAFSPASWSKDGTRVVGSIFDQSVNSIAIYDVGSRTFKEIANRASSPSWLPDSRRFVYANGSQELVIYDTQTKTTKQLCSFPREFFGSLDVAPDGRAIYASIFKPQSDIILAKLK
jgi:Tol biopolymer transport system component